MQVRYPCRTRAVSGVNLGTGTAYHPTELPTVRPYALPVPGFVPGFGPGSGRAFEDLGQLGQDEPASG